MSRANGSFSRRTFLKTSAAAFMLAGIPGTLTRCAKTAGKEIPVGVQLYCFRRELAEDFTGTISAVADMGYQGVEFADYFGRSAGELRKILDDHGLKACGTHIYLDDMLGDNVAQTVEFNQTLGNKNLIVRWLDEEMVNTPQAFQHTIDLFNQAIENVKPYGMRVGFHNHDSIFLKQDGEYLWNILADQTPREMILQLDTGNASNTGVDPIALLERNQGRSKTIHIKPYSAEHPDAMIGKDDLDWQRILRICETTGGTEWYIIEYEREGFDPLEALRINLENFQQLRV